MRFNGKDFADFGVFVDESKAFGSPEKDYELVEIMGRNGNLSIYNDRFKDITLPFPCFIRTGFIQKYRSLLAYLNSQTGYQRLETDKEPNHFRKALFQGIVDPQTTAFNHGGFFTVNLLAHPQRFLKSGEIPVPVSPVTETTSGNPAVIDNMSNLVQVDDLQIAIEPVQDLHGYDSPWVGGAGKNKLSLIRNAGDTETKAGVVYTVNSDSSISAVGTSTASNSYWSIGTVALKAGNYILTGCPSGGSSNSYFIAIRKNAYNGTLIGRDIGSGFEFELTEETQVYVTLYCQSGTVADFTFYPMIRLASEPDATFAPYENICPITGWTKATVTSSLKNLLQNTSSSSVNHGITFTKQSDSTVVANGTADGDASFIINFTWNLDDGDYQLSGCAEGGSADKYYCFLWDRSANTRAKDWDGNASESSFNPTQIVKVRLEHGVNYGFYLRVKAGVTVNNITFYPMICAKYHGTVYIKYTAKTVTCDFDRTVYGGYLDVTTGVLTVTHAYIDLGELNWGMNTANNFFYGTGTSNPLLEQLITQRDATGIRGAICEAYFDDTDFSALANLKDGAFVFNSTRISSTKNSLMIKDTRYTDATNFKTAVNGVHFVAELATPQTYQLTPSILKLSSGVTYNFADTGRIVSIRTISPATLTNPTRFDSKPIIRVWGNGTLNVNSYYITVANSPYDYIDIDCELMDCYHGSNNANQYVTFSTTGFVTLNSGANYFGYSGFSGVHVIPRWYEV